MPTGLWEIQRVRIMKRRSFLATCIAGVFVPKLPEEPKSRIVTFTIGGGNRNTCGDSITCWERSLDDGCSSCPCKKT